MSTIVETHGLSKIYGEGECSVNALKDINIKVNKGEFVAIVGKSGSGKSTLLHMIGGLDTPSSGEVIIDGEHLSQMNSEKATVFRRENIGFVFQQYNLITTLSAYENIVLPVQLDDNEVDEDYLEHILELLGIKKVLHKLPSQLSGGQQQRVAIARALSNKPKLLLCDEPTGNLDTRTTSEVLDLLKDTSKNLSQTIIMITHNDDVAREADRMICIEDGKILG